MEALMSNVNVEVDDKALADAARRFNTTTNDDTINAALREVSERQRRSEAFDRLAEMGQAGYFDELLDKRNYRR